MPPILNREQIRRLDRIAIDQYCVPGIVLMENAGRGVADVIDRLGGTGHVVICCGKGNNGGDGLVIARHLQKRGYAVSVVYWHPGEEWQGDAAINYRIAVASEIRLIELTPENPIRDLDAVLEPASCIVDAALGTGATGAMRLPWDEVMPVLNSARAVRVAVDVPTGLDCETGVADENTFRADHTCTFVAAKPGLVVPESAEYVGQLHIVDIGAPDVLVRKLLAES